MAARLSLRDYQRELAERLRTAGSSHSTSKLGIQVGAESWLVELADAGEVIPVPPVTPVPLTRHWFKGLANVRGKLYSVIDFPAFLGGSAVGTGDHARLLLLNERFHTAAALLVDRSLGLRNAAELEAREPEDGDPPWLKGRYADQDGRVWKELDLSQLAQSPEFLGVGD
jgi:twitching motility protein PilI